MCTERSHTVESAMMHSEISPQELDEIYSFAISLGKQAGQKLLAGVQDRIEDPHPQATNSGNNISNLAFVEKDNEVDIVTRVDEDVESFIRTAIFTKYPTHKFLGEESYAQTQCQTFMISEEQPTWCIDPLDGTVNYTHIFPMFCVSVSFILGGKPIIGVIYAPMQNQLFTACKGRGAYLNESMKLPLIQKPSIPPLPSNAPQKCILSCEWGKDRRDLSDGNLQRKVESFVNMATEVGGCGGKGGMVHGVRSLGSAALDMAYTAMGAFDIWWEGGCWEWDVAAGIAILLEAGGLVTTANPPNTPDTAPIEDAKLGGRLYLAIRPAGPSATETGRETQERTVREVWRRVRQLDYSRPGV